MFETPDDPVAELQSQFLAKLVDVDVERENLTILRASLAMRLQRAQSLAGLLILAGSVSTSSRLNKKGKSGRAKCALLLGFVPISLN